MRRAVIFIFIVCAVCVVAWFALRQGPARAQLDNHGLGNVIEGVYFIEFTQGSTSGLTLATLNPNGTFVLSDTTDLLLGTALNSTTHGVWEQAGPSGFVTRQLFFVYDTEGIVTSIAQIRASVTSDDHFQTGSGIFTTEVFPCVDGDCQDPLGGEPGIPVAPGELTFRRVTLD